MKTVTIRIFPDGIVHAETNGIKGEQCKNTIPIIEKLVNARHSEYKWTSEYYEEELYETTNQKIKDTNR